MFQTLLESRAPVDRRRRWTFASAGFHAATVTLVALLTLRPDHARPPERIVDVWPLAVPTSAPKAPARDHGRRASASTIPTAPNIQVPAVPIFDASLDYDRRSLTAVDVFIDGPPLTTPSDDVSGAALGADRVDRQVMQRSGNGQPVYPETLRASSLEGEVVARFVVDTLGRVEPLSIRILGSTHPLFAASVSKWLTRTTYVPAEYGGHVVRQLVEQRFHFALRR